MKNFIFCITLVLFSKSSFAYLDPGSTTFILQSIIAVIAGFFVTIGIYWYKFKMFIIKILRILKKKTNLKY